MRRALLMPLLLSCGLSACDEKVARPPVVEVVPGGPSLPVDHPQVGEELSLATARHSGRLSVDQIRRSLPVIAGPSRDGGEVTWMQGSRPGADVFSRALGEADYANITVENLEPSPLYAKFMDDAARDVCNRISNEDLNRPEGDPQTLYRHVAHLDTVDGNPAGVDQNLRYLKLRFHGVRIADDDVETLAPLRTLFSQAVVAARGTSTTLSRNHVREGWRLVCVALLTAPEFHIY